MTSSSMLRTVTLAIVNPSGNDGIMIANRWRWRWGEDSGVGRRGHPSLFAVWLYNFPTLSSEATVAFVTVKPKFQVTIPAKLRRGIDLREGDIMEATLVGDGILLKPQEVVDRAAAADRISAKFKTAPISSTDLGRAEGEIMSDTIDDIASSRQERRSRKA